VKAEGERYVKSESTTRTAPKLLPRALFLFFFLGLLFFLGALGRLFLGFFLAVLCFAHDVLLAVMVLKIVQDTGSRGGFVSRIALPALP
jgi:hypothetical protein